MARVSKARVEGFRSIRDPLELHLDGRVTVLLGANDHGKSNILRSLLHLNSDEDFDEEEDLNWDSIDSRDTLPRAQYWLRLEAAEQEALFEWAVITELAQKRAEIVESASARVEDLTSSLASISNQIRSARAELEAIVADEAASEDGPQTAAQLAALKERVADLDSKAAALESDLRIAKQQEDLANAYYSWQGLDAPTSASYEAELEAAEDELRAADDRAAAAARALDEATEAKNQMVATGAATQDQLDQAEDDLQDATRSLEVADAYRAERALNRDRLQRRVEVLRRHEDGESIIDESNLFTEADSTARRPPTEIVLERAGVGSPLRFVDWNQGSAIDVPDVIRQMIPRVELIESQGSVPDSVTAKSIEAEDHDFMRGIFYYAGLMKSEWASLFVNDDRTSKRLDKATQQLNEALRQAWTQGQNLRFELDHGVSAIELKINDPAVDGRYVRASRRSSGFTHFFSLKTILYARQSESPASSYIWLFDEPGIYLHPEGQHDLLRVMESLSAANQIVYTTHSIFLVNKNHPTRHRLILKGERGTLVDGKPYVGRWRSAIDALGLALPGTVLFASKVLLTEGDSDPILLGADLAKLVESGDIDLDLNPLSVMATRDASNAESLAQILQEGMIKPTIAFLFDGDKGGRERKAYLKDLIDRDRLAVVDLPRDKCIEGQLLAPELYREATIQYLTSVAELKGFSADVRAEMSALWETDEFKGDLAKWSRIGGQRVLALKSEPSTVGIARQYAALLDEADTTSEFSGRRRALALAVKIRDALGLAGTEASPTLIE